MGSLAAATQHGEQLDLFAGFDLPVAEPQRRIRCRRPAANEPRYIQLTLADPVEVLLPRVDLDEDYPVHLVVPAANCSRIGPVGPASVFDIGAAAAMADLMRRGQPEGTAPQQETHCRIAREYGSGVTKHTAMRYQDTEEWREKEERRRARQKPPKPPKQKFKTKGSRVWADAQS